MESAIGPEFGHRGTATDELLLADLQ